MKVYIVTIISSLFDNSWMLGIFSRKELAEKALESRGYTKHVYKNGFVFWDGEPDEDGDIESWARITEEEIDARTDEEE